MNRRQLIVSTSAVAAISAAGLVGSLIPASAIETTPLANVVLMGGPRPIFLSTKSVSVEMRDGAPSRASLTLGEDMSPESFVAIMKMPLAARLKVLLRMGVAENDLEDIEHEWILESITFKPERKLTLIQA